MPNIQKASEQVCNNRKHSSGHSAKKTRCKFAAVAVAALLASTVGFGDLAVQAVYADATSPPSAGTQGFTDVPATHWAYNSITEMKNRGVIAGFADGTFRPEDKVTKAQFDKMLVGLFDLEVLKESGDRFSDLNEAAWAADAINTAEIYGFIPKIYTGEYKPNNTVSRAEGSYGLQKLMEHQTGKTEDSPNAPADFIDGTSIPNYAKDAIYKMVNIGLVKGFPDNSFRPGESLTRAQAAKLLHSVYIFVMGDKVVVTPPVVEQPVFTSPTYVDKSKIIEVVRGYGDTIFITTTEELPCDGTNRSLFEDYYKEKIVFLPLTGCEEWSFPKASLKEFDINSDMYKEEYLIKSGMIKRREFSEVNEENNEKMYQYKINCTFEKTEHVFMYLEKDGYSNIDVDDYKGEK